MIRSPILWLVALTACAGLSLPGCGEVDPVHPLDPETPVLQQRPSLLRGQLIPPTGFEVSTVQSVIVHLDPIGTQAVSRTGAVEEDGRFEIPDIIPGSYRLTAWGPGLSGGPVVVEIPLGANLELGSVPLVPVLGQVKGWVFTMAGHPATGAVVSADDGYEVTVVDTEGRFTLRVLEGSRTVNVVLNQYQPWTSEDLSVEAWSEVYLESPVFLPPFNGDLIGQIALRQFSTPLRLSNVTMTLDPVIAEVDDSQNGENDDADPPPEGLPDTTVFRDTRESRTDFNPDETGVFTLTDVEPGHYHLKIRSDGYDSQSRPIFINPGQPTNLGLIELSHTSTSHHAVMFEGRVRTGGVGLVGIGVEVAIVSDSDAPDLDYHRVLTDSNGRFMIPASPDEMYRVRAVITGFNDLNEGPFRYAPGQGFRDPAGNVPDFNLGLAGP